MTEIDDAIVTGRTKIEGTVIATAIEIDIATRNGTVADAVEIIMMRLVSILGSDDDNGKL